MTDSAVGEIPQPDRLCARSDCRRPLRRNPGENPARFARRSYCDAECMARRVPAPPSRQCERPGCDAPIVPATNERTSALAKRRFCSPECWTKRQVPLAAWQPPDWHLQAVCAEIGGGVFDADQQSLHHVAARVCASCPFSQGGIASVCVAEGLLLGDDATIRGGRSMAVWRRELEAAS